MHTKTQSPAVELWADELWAAVTTLEGAAATLQRLETAPPPAGGPADLAALLDLFDKLNVRRFHPDAKSARGDALGAALRNALAVSPALLERCLANAARAVAALGREGVQVEGLEVVTPSDFATAPLPTIGTGTGRLAVGRLDELRPGHPLRAAIAEPYRSNGRDVALLGPAGAAFYFMADAAALTAKWVTAEKRDREERAAAQHQREAADLAQWEQSNPQAALAARVRELEEKLAEQGA